MTEREKGKVYTCPVCGMHGFAWDGLVDIWRCHDPGPCRYAEQHKDPVDDQLQTLFRAVRYLVQSMPPPLEAGFARNKEQYKLVMDLDAIIALRERE